MAPIDTAKSILKKNGFNVDHLFKDQPEFIELEMQLKNYCETHAQNVKKGHILGKSKNEDGEEEKMAQANMV